MNVQRIAFVDSRVAELIPLLREFRPDLRVIEVDELRNVAALLTETLATHPAVQAIDLFGHGRSGRLELGLEGIDLAVLSQSAAAWQKVGGQLAAGAGMYLYGCAVGSGEDGARFVARLSELTGRPVAASHNAVGDAALGGGWVFDVCGDATTEAVPPPLSLPMYRGLLGVVTGGSGNDSLIGTVGDDSLFGGDGNDTIESSPGNDTIVAGDGDDLVIAAAGAQTIDLGAGNDIVQAALGTLADGGSGDDVLTADLDFSKYPPFATGAADRGISYSFGVSASMLYASDDIGYSAIHEALLNASSGMRILLPGTMGTALSATGFEGFQINVVGTVGADLILLQGGIRYDGGSGEDTLYADWSSATSPVRWTNDPTVAQSVCGASIAGMERLLVATGSGNDLIQNPTGSSRDQIFTGAGNDTIDGGRGVDEMTGGAGDDTYMVDDSADVVSEAVGEGIDAVISTASSYTLPDNVERLSLSEGAISGSGNAQNNLLYGSQGNNALIGGAGNDTLSGIMGNDTLDGASGIDSMVGGTGNDVYYRDNVADVIFEYGGEGYDTVYSSVSYVLDINLEKVVLTGAATIAYGNGQANLMIGNALDNRLSGAASADTLQGEAGSDTLDGGSGVDSLVGGGGNDLYLVDNAGDVIVETAGAGSDRVWASANFTLASGVSAEVLTLMGSATSLTGNELANQLVGGSRNDSLSGAGGNDRLVGLGGTDTLVGGAGNDTLDGGTGVDRLLGGVGDDLYLVDSAADVIVEDAGEGLDRLWASVNYVLGDGVSVESMTLMGTATQLTGNALANNLYGGRSADHLAGLAGDDNLIASDGNDTLVGGLGNDTLAGDAGNDLFLFESALATGSNVDTIVDLATGDLIGLDNDVFTALGAAGALSASQFTSGAGVTGADVSGQVAGVYYDTTAGALYYDADGFGGAAAVQLATLTSKPGLTVGSVVVQE